MSHLPSIFALLGSLSLVSCAKKETPVEEPKPAPVTAAPEPSLPEPTGPVIEPLDFADPNTTQKLITAEETKTVVSTPKRTQSDQDAEDSVINVPPPLPEATLPEPASN
ncbi:MAG: hypothetical protein ACSHYF_01105 [Verrucomicrobiaceae bacterium]